ncbi:hypothetical protein, partial [Sedimentibacter sp. B4]|uniref:hypothetical protein n=1 Tax=Sedimentibacter sp. B4 TaxID=304766 RepID=UPI00058BAB74
RPAATDRRGRGSLQVPVQRDLVEEQPVAVQAELLALELGLLPGPVAELLLASLTALEPSNLGASAWPAHSTSATPKRSATRSRNPARGVVVVDGVWTCRVATSVNTEVFLRLEMGSPKKGAGKT